MSETQDQPRIDPLLDDDTIALSESQGVPILAPDYPISLKKRVHIAYDPIQRDYLATNTIAEACDQLRSRSHNMAIICSQQGDESPKIYGSILLNE